MMPTFPRCSLSFRTAGFPQDGWKAGFPSGAFPDRQRFKPAPGIRRPTSGLHPPFMHLVVTTVVPHCVGPQTRLRTTLEGYYSSAPGALAQGPGYSVPVRHHLIGPIRPTRGQRAISPHGGARLRRARWAGSRRSGLRVMGTSPRSPISRGIGSTESTAVVRPEHWDALPLSAAIECMTIERLTLGKMAKSAPRPPFGPPVVLGARPHLASGLQGRRKSANIHASSGVIWGMSTQSQHDAHDDGDE
jgi:hypothetical protein